MANKPTTVTAYLASLPVDRRKALQAVRKVIKSNLDPSIKEGIQYGMIGYFVPHKVYPDGYHCDPKQPLPFLSLASQKNHMGLYLFCVYASLAEKDRFVAEWQKSGKKLDMGKSCVRFKKIEDVPLEVVGEMVRRLTAKKFIASYEASLAERPSRAPAKKVAKKKTAKKKTAKKKVTKKKATKKTTTRR